MYSKESITLSGVLMVPLAIGRRAVVFSQSRFLYTAPILAIHNQSAGTVQFETRDTGYTLFLDPLAQAANCLSMQGMAA